MKNSSLKNRFRYWFDNAMAKGPIAMIGLLFGLSVILILVVSLIVTLLRLDIQPDGTRLGFINVTWMSLMRTLDAGTMGGDRGSWPFLISMFAVTLGGVFVVSTLIGVLSSGIEGKIDELRKGRSFVVEEGHTVILGWSSQVFTVVSELVLANENRRRACIATLAEKDKVEMEDELKARVGDTKTTHIVCRSGNPIELTDLEIVNPHAARSIIILAPESPDADTQTIKTILAITNNPRRHKEPYHIVAELRDPQNLEAARLVGKQEAEIVRVDELIARITAQTCRQSGLSTIYTELLDFGGDEIYFKDEPGLVGKTVGEALLAYEDSALIDIQYRDGRVQLLPPLQTQIQPGDQIIAISEDDDSICLSRLADYQIDPGAIRNHHSNGHGPERTLILGWNRRAPIIIKELDNYVAPLSQITVLGDKDEMEIRASCDCEALRNEKIMFLRGDTTNRRVLDSLNIPSFNHVITLSASDLHDAQQADARSIITLLHLREISDHNNHPFSIVSEMLDSRNRELAEVTHADDFIVSDKLISLIMSQISENKALNLVFEDLFDPEGAELYLKPAGDYIALGKPVNFYTVVKSAQERSEIAIGYRIKADASDPLYSYGVHVNPNKSALVTFSAEDKIIVLAES